MEVVTAVAQQGVDGDSSSIIQRSSIPRSREGRSILATSILAISVGISYLPFVEHLLNFIWLALDRYGAICFLPLTLLLPPLWCITSAVISVAMAIGSCDQSDLDTFKAMIWPALMFLSMFSGLRLKPSVFLREFNNWSLSDLTGLREADALAALIGTVACLIFMPEMASRLVSYCRASILQYPKLFRMGVGTYYFLLHLVSLFIGYAFLYDASLTAKAPWTDWLG